MKVVVIGAGIVGVASALWARRDGHEVVLVDREGPAAGASYGNGAVLARCSVVPVTTPGLMRRGLRMALDPSEPLFLRWAKLPGMAGWLARYLSHANAADTARIADGLAHVVADSVEQHEALAAGTEAARYLAACDYAYVYADRAAWEADAYGWGLRAAAGFVPEIVEGAAVREREPSLGPAAGLMAVLREHGMVLDPGGYVAALAAQLEREGGTVRRAEVRDVTLEGGRVVAVETGEGPIPCDRVVVAAGAWSGPLMMRLGIDVPLAAERGYHLVWRAPEVRPSIPLMLAGAKFVATPVAAGLRCAGIVELGGMDGARSRPALDLMRRRVRETFPGLTAEPDEAWLGFRPAPSDSLPLIGEVRETGVIAAFGHHHVGLTAGPKTGRMVADVIAGRRSNVDRAPFDPLRFV
ncbi:FAD-dependent oxidoreductase [Jannaschia sp. Os4]|uniref:NAD(P)/FAD-dependent oxidoreductase n=1 Tax=Jannaschia sp. Os4 TaxID=2807617 RepID=UPI0019399090|nr:FAD-dependent oxidoreductase [Jannaschia sp. Os4]MBM2575593.1 FAD-dependent oxidoreductase [Jannaschia sp. Os4]